jgi:hypothetical protein
VVPANALVDLGGRRGVLHAAERNRVFRAVQVGTEQRRDRRDPWRLAEGNDVITTGSGNCAMATAS